MKNKIKYNTLLFAMTALFIIWGCSSSDEPKPAPLPNPPPEIPVTPPSPNPPSGLSTVADIKSGKYSKGDEVYLYGYLTQQKSNDDDEWYFTDDAGANEIILDFPTSQVPAVNTNILVYGGVDDIGEVDVISWAETDTKPVEPTPPPFPPKGVTPPALTITAVSEINSGTKIGEVIIAGHLTTNKSSDCDEQQFTDGTGSLEVEFQGCSNLPAVGTPIYIYGKTDGRYEVDVFSWAPQ